VLAREAISGWMTEWIIQTHFLKTRRCHCDLMSSAVHDDR
jgi:hypothetical protein